MSGALCASDTFGKGVSSVVTNWESEPAPDPAKWQSYTNDP